MELVLDEAQTILRESADKLVERHAGPARFRELRATEHGIGRKRLMEVGEAGWLSLLVPEEQDGGGLGLGATEAALVLESAGRGLITEPVAAMMASARAIASGFRAMEPWLDIVMDGSCIIVPALDDPDGTRVQSTDTGYDVTLTGSVHDVPCAAAADGFIVNTQCEAYDGPTVCLVLREAEGLKIQDGRRRVDGTSQGTVVLDNVAVDPNFVLASGERGADLVASTMDLMLLGTSAEMLGIMDQGLALAVDYLGTREQFGRPIGSFQALQHRAVNDHVDIELTRSLLYQVCAALDEGRGNRAMVAAVKARASDAVLSVVKSVVQMHGAIGFTDECNASLYLRRAMSLSSQYGNAAWHRKRYARLSSLTAAECAGPWGRSGAGEVSNA